MALPATFNKVYIKVQKSSEHKAFQKMLIQTTFGPLLSISNSQAIMPEVIITKQFGLSS